MKKKKILNALVIGALIGAMTLGTTNPVKAATDITIDGSSSGSSDKWSSATADADGLHTYKSGGDEGDTYTYWAHKDGHDGDTLTMTGGSLVVNSLPNGHDWIKASDGNITVNSGPLNINGSSEIKSAVDLRVNSNGRVNITGGNVVLNSGDQIYGTINATSGSLTVSGGDHQLNSSSVIGSSVNFAVTGGTLRFDNASTLQKSFTNAGSLWFYSGIQDDNIANTANTTIHFVGANNSGNLTGGTENVVFTNNTSSSVTSESNSGSIAARNLYVGESSTDIGNFTNNGTITTTGDIGVRSGSSFTNSNGKSLAIGGSLSTQSGASTTIVNAGDVTFSSTSGKYVNDGSLTFRGGAIGKGVSGNGTTYISTGSVTNNSAISQAVNVASGTLDNATGGSISGVTTINATGTLNNTAGTLANVTNNGSLSISDGSASVVTNNKTLSISGGTVSSVNNADSTNSTATQTAGTVSGAVTNEGSYSISGGSIGGTLTNNKTLSIAGGTVASVNNASSTNSTATQTAGTVSGAVTNAGSYSISGGSIGGTLTNNKTLSISGGTVASVNNASSTNSTATQTAGTVSGTVTNAGSYTLSGTGSIGGKVTNSGTFNLQNSGVSTFEQTSAGAVTNITNDGSLTIGSGSSITGGTVNIENSTALLDNLIINNGTTNTAKVTTTGSSSINIQNGALTTATGTNIGNGAAVTIGTASGTTGTLNVTNGTVALGTNDNWNAKGTVNVNGGTLNLNGVTQTGTLSQTLGTTNISSAQALGTGASITGGTLNVNEDLTLNSGSTLTVGSGNASVYIVSGKNLNISGGTVTLDGNSGTSKTYVDWVGDVNLSSGSLTLKNIYDTSRNASGNKSGVLNATGGSLTIDNSNVLLGNNDVIANAVALTLTGDLTVTSNAAAYISSADSWTAGDLIQTGGTLSLDGVSTAAGKTLNSDGGTLNVLNNTTLATGSDYIKENTVINLASGNTLTINNSTTAASTDGVTFDAGDTTVPRAADSWLGNITQTGGLLTFKNRTGVAAEDQTSATKTFNMSDGKLVLNNSSLTLNEGSAITGGIVEIDPSDLVFNNNTDNSATILMTVDDGSTLTIIGGDTSVDPAKYTTLTLLTGSNLDYGTVTVGDGTNKNVLNIYNNADIAGDVIFNVLDNATANVAGTSKLVINGTAASSDVWNGTINQTAGTITFIDDIVKDSTTAKLTSNGGNIIIGYVDTVDPTNNKAGSLTLNNSGDSITSATAVTINTNGTLNQSAGTVILDNVNDTWNGAIALSSTGDLTLDGRTDVTDATQTYNQTGGKLTINNGGSLTLDTSDSVINGTSEVVLGSVGVSPAPDTAGSLILNNNSSNQAKITTAGTGANVLTVEGADTSGATPVNTKLTLTDGSDIESGTVTVGDTTNNYANELTMSGDSAGSKISRDVTMVINGGANGVAKVNMTGTKADLTINTGDTWNGQIDQTAGTLTVLNDDYTRTTGYLTSTNGKIVIGDVVSATTVPGTLILNNALDSVASATAVEINSNGILRQSDGTVALDQATDTWDGAIELSDNGQLSIADFSGTDNVVTDGTVRYNQTGGKVTFNNTDLELAAHATKPSAITDGSVTLTNASTLTVSNGLATNKAAVTMAAATETLNVNKDTTMTLDHYTYDPAGVNQLIETSVSAGSLNIGDVADNTDHSTLAVSSGTIAQAANVAINEGSALNITGATAADESTPGAADAIVASVTLDSADTWNGDINLSNAGTADDKNTSLTLTGVTKTTGADPTFDNTGSSPYYSQTGGSLALTNNTVFSMTDSSLIKNSALPAGNAGNMTVDSTSEFHSLSNAFSLTNLTNAGLVDGINGGYENYAVSAGLYAGDNSGDKQGDFTTDLYARCDVNNNFKYDSYGSDSATIYASDASKQGVLNVSDWKLNGDIFGWDAPIDRSYNMTKLFKGSVADGHTINFTSTNKEVFTPIGWYGLHSNGGGNYSFSLNRFNPGVFRGQVTTIAQYQNQLMIDDMLFNHTMLDQGFKGNDYIASNPNRLASATDLYPPYQYSRRDGGVWVKAYGTFEKLNMNHGLNVGNNAYGTLIGVDFGLKDLRHGWQFMPTAYIGYNGAHQYWNGYGAYQNGGQLGVMGTWYKNDFMIGALAYGGVYGNEMDTPRGNDSAFNYFAGGSVKGAYNWRFAKDWALQPNLLVAYNYFGQQNWHTDFGQMGMMSGMLNGINIAPGLNLIWEKETFSIYGTIQYMYNVNQSTGGRAGHVGLPHVHMDRGYIQYGIGVNKRFSDRFSGFLQAVIRNVGRNGIGLQAGFQWQFGKGSSQKSSGDKIKTGNVTPELKKTEITLNGNKIQ